MIKNILAKIPNSTSKTMLGFILVQIIIISLFFACFNSSKPVEIKDCSETQLVVEDKKYARKYNEYTCRVFSNGNRYDFPNLGPLGEYSTEEIYNDIKIGETIDVTYIERNDLFGKYNYVVDASNKNKKYMNFAVYETQQEIAFLSVIMLFGIIEFSFILILGMFIIFHCPHIRRKIKK